MNVTSEKALHPHERVAFQKRRLLWILGGLSLICVAGMTFAIWLWNWRQSHRVSVILVAAAKRGEPVSGDELNAYFRAPEPENDATALWVAGMQPLIEGGYHQSVQGVPYVGDERDGRSLAGEIPSHLQSRATAHLKQYADSLAKFHAAAAKGGRARLPVDFRAGVGTLLPFTQASRDACRLLLLDVDQKAAGGDDRGSAKSLLTLLLLGRCLEQEPCAISQNVCSAIEVQGVDALASLLGRLNFTPEELTAFANVIASRKVNDRMHCALVGERVMGVSAMQNPDELRVLGKSVYIPVTNADLALYLEHIERVIAAAKLDFPECITAAQVAQDQLEKESSQGLAMLTSDLTKALTPDFKKSFIVHAAYATAKNRAALAAIAVERFRRKNGEVPQTLQELAPEFLVAEPIDPFTGNVMLYRVTPAGILIYSVGDNLIDDLGADLSGLDRGVLIPRKSSRMN